MYPMPDFLSPEECQAIIQEMDAVDTVDAEVYGHGAGQLLSQEIRKTKICNVSRKTEVGLRQRMQSRQPEVEDFFKLPTGELERPQFLKYMPGYYFKPHQDHSTPAGHPDRVITYVLFLNQQVPNSEPWSDPHTFQGGELLFYSGSARLPGMVGLALSTAPGLMIAFRSEMVHEVGPVTQGNRYTIINFYADLA